MRRKLRIVSRTFLGCGVFLLIYFFLWRIEFFLYLYEFLKVFLSGGKEAIIGSYGGNTNVQVKPSASVVVKVYFFGILIYHSKYGSFVTIHLAVVSLVLLLGLISCIVRIKRGG